jgi:hypothetical protein
MPRLTEYLLKLSTDAEELKKFRALRAKEHGHLLEYLTQQPFPGLTKHQAEVIYGHDSHDVVHAVMDELKGESSRRGHGKHGDEFYGIPVTFVVECNTVLQHTHDPE